MLRLFARWKKMGTGTYIYLLPIIFFCTLGRNITLQRIHSVPIYPVTILETWSFLNFSERGWGETQRMAGHLLHRAKVWGEREETAARQGVQREGSSSLQLNWWKCGHISNENALERCCGGCVALWVPSYLAQPSVNCITKTVLDWFWHPPTLKVLSHEK